MVIRSVVSEEEVGQLMAFDGRRSAFYSGRRCCWHRRGRSGVVVLRRSPDRALVVRFVPFRPFQQLSAPSPRRHRRPSAFRNRPLLTWQKTRKKQKRPRSRNDADPRATSLTSSKSLPRDDSFRNRKIGVRRRLKCRARFSRSFRPIGLAPPFTGARTRIYNFKVKDGRSRIRSDSNTVETKKKTR